MNAKTLLRRLASLVLAAAVLGGLLSFPSTQADDTGFDLSGTAFTDPEVDTGIMYFWHEGMPTVSRDKNGNLIKYPVIISWKDKYYLCTDGSFRNELNETHSKQKNETQYVGIGIGSTWEYLSSDVYGYKDFERVWGDSDYYMLYTYDMSGDALISKLNLDVNSLLKYGESVSINPPANLPYVVYTDPEKDQYAIGLPTAAFGEDYWLVGRTRTWEWINTGLFGEDVSQEGHIQWGLDYEYWKADQFLDKYYQYSTTRSLYYVNYIASGTYTEGPDQHYWTVKRDKNGKYHFWTTGESDVSGMERVSGSFWKDDHRERTKAWQTANDIGRMGLYYTGSTVGVRAETIKYADWKDRKNTVENTDGFKVYYGDPNIVSFHRESFQVEKGQVVNLDGPRVIDTNCTVTVRDGGVLSCSGWVINNGQIIVEPGGMLILQGRTTATGDSQMGAITSVGVKAGQSCGRIACDGTIIVNRDCKLCCGGAYGLQLGEGAQVVNYGQIIAENLEIYSDHTIENRGDSSAVFAGWGITDSGYALTRSSIIGQDYNAKGTREKAAAVRIPKNGVYGDGADRLYVNTAGSVSYTSPAPKKGYVSGRVAWSDPGEPSVLDLPEDIPIYYDEEYGISFIKVKGMIYHYNAITSQWVNIRDGIRETYYDYRMPSRVEEYLEDSLPEGYVLTSGIVVGQKQKENLKWDPVEQVFWFYEEADETYYYYEENIEDYIHVNSFNNTYYRYNNPIAPPPNYSSSVYVPVDMYNKLPAEFSWYDEQMEETANPAGIPKVQVEGKRYYVELEGTKYYWNTQYEQFLPEDFTLKGDKPVGGITQAQVDLGWYDLSLDPTAKPKVNIDEDGYYYVLYQGNRYTWWKDYQKFFWGTPNRYMGVLVKSDVDLNGYTLP